jgi:ribonuclease PH
VVVDPDAHKPKRKESNHNITVIKKINKIQMGGEEKGEHLKKK